MADDSGANYRGEIVVLNLQAEKQFGSRRDEVVGQQVTNIIPQGFAEGLIAGDVRSAAPRWPSRSAPGSSYPRGPQGWQRVPILLNPLESAQGILVSSASGVGPASRQPVSCSSFSSADDGAPPASRNSSCLA